MQNGTRSIRYWLGALLVAALITRLVAGYAWQSRLPANQRFAFGDSESYWYLGEQLATGRPYRFGPGEGLMFRTPGYPMVLACLFKTLGPRAGVMSARALSAVLSTVAVGLAVLLAYRLFDSRTALLTAVLGAFSPDLIATGVFVLSEAPFCPLMMLQLVAWERSRSATSAGWRYGWAAFAGISGGCATLMRPSWLLFLPFALVIGWGTQSFRTRHTKIMIVMAMGLMVAMGPWWWRNYVRSGQFVLTTLQVGASLYDAWHPEATGSSDMRFVPGFVEEQRQADADSGSPPVGLFEARLDRRMRDAAIAWARTHPTRVAKLALIKLVRIWSPVPHAQEMRNPILRLAIAIGYLPIIVAAVYGVVRFWSRGWQYQLCCLPAVYFTLLHMIFVGSMRYRQPAMFALAVLAAGALMHGRQGLRVFTVGV